MEKPIGMLKVTEVIDNPDGTATINFDVSDETKDEIKKTMGWKRWSNKKFTKLVVDALDHLANKVSEEKTNNGETGCQ